LHHPAAAYAGPDLRPALAFFREHGFLLLPDAVPPKLLVEARVAVASAGAAAATSPAVLALFRATRAWDLVAELVDDPLPPTRAQVSSVPRSSMTMEPSSYFPEDLHIDGVFEDGRIENFACLVGVPLDAFPEHFMGNFGVFPGSHRRLAKVFSETGPNAFCKWMHEAPADVDSSPAKPYAAWRKKLRNMFCSDSYELLRVELGQAYIVHYQTVHFYHLNLRGADPRTVLYFRVWPRRGVAPGGLPKVSEPAALSDVWLEFPKVAALPHQCGRDF